MKQAPFNKGDLVEFVDFRDPFYDGVWEVMSCFDWGTEDYMCRIKQDSFNNVMARANRLRLVFNGA